MSDGVHLRWRARRSPQDPRGRAQAIALNLEYNWQPDLNYARAALADMRMQFAYDGIETVSLSREGDRDQWENRWLVKSEKSPEAFLEQINQTLESRGRWAKVSAAATGSATSLWKFADEQGLPWSGAASVEALRGLAVKWAVQPVSLRGQCAGTMHDACSGLARCTLSVNAMRGSRRGFPPHSVDCLALFAPIAAV